MPTPVFVPAPVIMHHNNYSNHPMTSQDWKMLIAFWITIHILPILWIIITFIISKIKKDKYYDTFDEEFSWASLGILFIIDLVLLISKIIYSIL